MTQNLDHCRQLGHSVREWLQAHTDENRSSQEGPERAFFSHGQKQFLAVLLDYHQPIHGDSIVYEYLIRQRGFQSLIAQASKPETRAKTELTTLALLEEARTIFIASALARLAAFLEGFTDQEFQLSSMAETCNMDRRESGHSQMGAIHEEPLAPKTGSPTESLSKAEKDLRDAAIDIAIRQGLIQPSQRSEVCRGHRNFFHYYLEDSRGATLARVHFGIIKAELGFSHPAIRRVQNS